MSYLIDIKRLVFDGKDIWWFVSQDIPVISRETDANHQVMLYG